MSEKLQKILARSGYGSRRQLEFLIKNGRISVNGSIAKLGQRISLKDISKLKIIIDDFIVPLKCLNKISYRVIAYHKLEGELCTQRISKDYLTVFEHLPKILNSRWISIGRLDVNTSGLLLFTNDGELANRLMHPFYHIDREYLVRVFGKLNEKKVKKLTSGVELEDGIARFEDVKYSGGRGINKTFYVVINEGRNRIVRRLWNSQGVMVNRLKRVRYGPIYLDKKLLPGNWQEVESKKVNELRSLVKL
ncbi:ribosomal large subunit pseudouridine synthase B [Candidatus Photodesmus katoptron]|uniref:Pseudouridine synthase n=1 Tax=Candidatus Photodesmus katoptron Akat1 TaxID=1236703 RepID=S3E037_9GAMM|nr:ribosomal large subunit pseudouridine synthase [Candidatus Photodesmus katoptron Akat1]KEY90707.1 ribosomal large subunit pseudouridine synthase B [Candidatus Photodesmus katoptron]